MAHELGHHVLGHSVRGTAAIATLDGEEIREFTPSWVAELEADVFALRVIVMSAIKEGKVSPESAIDGEFLLEALTGVEHFLLTAEMLERLAGSDHGSATHPPIWLRRKLIEEDFCRSPFYAWCEPRLGGYSNAVSLLWRTLASPDQHSQRGWETERSEVRQRVLRILAGYAPDRVAPTLNDLLTLRFNSSQLFFDNAIAEVAAGGDKIWRPDGPHHAQGFMHELCDTPQMTLSQLDPSHPFLGIAPQLDPQVGSHSSCDFRRRDLSVPRPRDNYRCRRGQLHAALSGLNTTLPAHPGTPTKGPCGLLPPGDADAAAPGSPRSSSTNNTCTAS